MTLQLSILNITQLGLINQSINRLHLKLSEKKSDANEKKEVEEKKEEKKEEPAAKEKQDDYQKYNEMGNHRSPDWEGVNKRKEEYGDYE